MNGSVRRWLGPAAGLAALLATLAACQTPDVAAPPSGAPQSATTATGSGVSSPATSLAPRLVLAEGPTQSDRDLVRSFVLFAGAPGATTAADIPFARTGVRIGLASRLLAFIPAERLADRASWTIDLQPYFRGYVGPFEVLDPLVAHVGSSPGRDVLDSLQVSLGAHPHCASPPVPAPPEVSGLRRVSLQPAEGTIDSCLSWFTTDLYVDGRGQVVAVTFDMWEP